MKKFILSILLVVGLMLSLNLYGSGTILGNFNGNFYGSFIGTYPVKTSFYTNYTLTTNDALIICSGTNQLITTPSSLPVGKIWVIYEVSTNGSAVLTNTAGTTYNGALSVTITNNQHIGFFSDGSNWYY